MKKEIIVPTSENATKTIRQYGNTQIKRDWVKYWLKLAAVIVTQRKGWTFDTQHI